MPPGDPRMVERLVVLLNDAYTVRWNPRLLAQRLAEHGVTLGGREPSPEAMEAAHDAFALVLDRQGLGTGLPRGVWEALDAGLRAYLAVDYPAGKEPGVGGREPEPDAKHTVVWYDEDTAGVRSCDGSETSFVVTDYADNPTPCPSCGTRLALYQRQYVYAVPPAGKEPET